MRLGSFLVPLVGALHTAELQPHQQHKALDILWCHLLVPLVGALHTAELQLHQQHKVLAILWCHLLVFCMT